jgi:hypothetical protein
VTELSIDALLGLLPKARLSQLGQHLGVAISESATQEAQLRSDYECSGEVGRLI